MFNMEGKPSIIVRRVQKGDLAKMSVEYKDYYQVLGVSRTASQDEIAKAYKKLARKHHPDLNQDNKEAAEEKFKEINEAYEVLRDEEKRRMYDQLGSNWQHGQQFQGAPGFENFNFNFGGGQGGRTFTSGGTSGFSDFFDMLFGGLGGNAFGGGDRSGAQMHFGADPFSGFAGFAGGRGQHGARGQDVEANVTITLEEAHKGGRKTVTVQGPNGRRTLDFSIPAGIREGARIRLTGQGEPGAGQGSPGDLYLRVHFASHPQFKVEGSDLIYDLSLRPWEAALGMTVRVPTLDGDVDLNIAPGTSSDRKLRLRGKGLGGGPNKNKGDQIVRLTIRMPEKMNDAQHKLWNELAAAYKSST